MADQGSQANSGSPSAGSNQQAIKSQLSSKFQKNRHLVLKLHSVLTWEQDFHPFAVGGATTLLFLIIYYLDASVLTTLSLLGLVSAVIDYALPVITKSLCDTSKWTDKDVQRLDKICTDLAKAYCSVKAAMNAACEMKTSSPNIYYPCLLSAFVVGAWIGHQFNNLFLTYLIVSLFVLYPGLEKKNVPQKLYETVMSKIGRRTISASGDRKQSTGRRSS